MSRGLTQAQVELAHDTHGFNVLPRAPRKKALQKLVAQFTHFFALLLWVAAALSFIARMPQLSFAIIGVIFINALFAFIQGNRADRSVQRLLELLPRNVTVVRDGLRQTIAAQDVVVGDLLILESGDRIPADSELKKSNDLGLDTSMLTGESEMHRTHLGESLFAGTFVVEGDGEAVVTAIGEATRFASIASASQQSAQQLTPLAHEMRRLAQRIAVLAIGIGLLFLVITWLLGNPLSDAAVFGIGVMVALVPEALLPTVTLTLALGAERMAKDNVLVRELEAVETLGSTTVVCTDKTGTLTRNEMSVVKVWTPTLSVEIDSTGYDPTAPLTYPDENLTRTLHELAFASALSCEGYAFISNGQWRAHGDPMEAALDVFARRIDPAFAANVHAPDVRFPFDPRRRRMSVVFDKALYVKGAPDSVLPLCINQGNAQDCVDAYAELGLRVLAVAYRKVETQQLLNAQEAECELTLLGLFGLEDPPRSDVADAIQQCRAAGVAVVMLTGDHPATATSVANQVGLRTHGDLVITGDQLPKDDRELAELASRHGTIIARVTPEDKLRIAKALRAHGEVVAMTGDGVNDVPALVAADVGIAMGISGTDVAREAADLVLLDDHFKSIVTGIALGRVTFQNTRKFLTYHLTDNVCELMPFVIWAATGGAIPLAIGVLQILAIDIGTDSFTAVALGAEPPNSKVLAQPPITGRLANRTVLRRAFGFLGPIESGVSLVAFFASLYVLDWRLGDPTQGSDVMAASGAAFLAIIFGQTANAFACRSSRFTPWQLGWFTNRLLLPATFVAIAISLGLIFIPALSEALEQSAPPLVGWIIALSSIPIVLGSDAFAKFRYARHSQIIAQSTDQTDRASTPST
jgi:magnesium-transporting ATPase (P-type)